MAAILPHLAEPDETTPIEREFYVCTGSLNGLGDAGSCPTPDAVLADAHAGLLGMTFVREAVAQSLMGKSFVAQAGNAQGKDQKTVYLVLDEPIGPGPAWNPATNPNVRQYGLLSWTSKMNCPSWSIPAGAPQIGGTCPGAIAGQSIVHDKLFDHGPKAGQRQVDNARRLVNIGLQRPEDKPVDLAKSICEHCYATGGQYSTGQVQFAQLLRHYWTVQALALQTFVPTMIYAIQNANYRLEGGAVTTEEEVRDEETGEVKLVKKTEMLSPEVLRDEHGNRRRFFRIHDSGDFFSPEYLEAWKAIAIALPDITFWAPTRIWATSWGIEAVRGTIEGSLQTPSNLIIRPSAYEVGGPVPDREFLGDGWAAGTTVIFHDDNKGMGQEREQYVASKGKRTEPRAGKDERYDWDCQAYAVDDKKHTCRKAVAPPGLGGTDGKGCRACWVEPSEIVNYTLH